MSDWPTHVHPNLPSISTGGLLDGLEATGMNADDDSFVGTVVYPAANRAHYVGILVREFITVTKLSIGNGAVVSGNFDVGIYDAEGNRLVSSGSTAQVGTGVTQTVDITDTALAPGRYFLAVNFDNATAEIQRSPTHTRKVRGLPVYQEAVGALALPAVATFAVITSANFTPLITLHRKVTI